MDFIEICPYAAWSKEPKSELVREGEFHATFWIATKLIDHISLDEHAKDSFEIITQDGRFFICDFPPQVNTNDFSQRSAYIRRLLKGELNMGNLKDVFIKERQNGQ